MIVNQSPTTAEAQFDLEKILSPIQPEQFFDQYWEQEPLVIRREDAQYFHSLLNISHVDQILDLHRPTGKSIRVIKDQAPLLASKYENQDGSLNLNQLYAAYADGYTVVINEVQRFCQPLKILCAKMSAALSHQTVANMYLTPKNQKALKPHYDTHDVFAIQAHGTKVWRIYDATTETPLLNSFQPIFKREQLKNMREITLRAGDMMYMPRGVPHEAYTTDESSLHITLGVNAVQWIDLLYKSIQQLAFSEVKLRNALPPGFLKAENWNQKFYQEMEAGFKAALQSVAENALMQGGVHLLAEEFRKDQLLRGDGHFAHLDEADTLTLDTRLEKRQDAVCSVQNLGTIARISFPGNTIKGPSHITPALQFIAQAKGAFLLKDLPDLSDTNKVKLAARLIRGGLLKLS